MRSLLFVFVLLFCSVASASPSDFARRLCREEPATYICTTVKIPKKAKRQYKEWAELFPNATMRHIVMSINRRNTLVWNGHTVAVPRNYTPDLLAYSPFPRDTSLPLGKYVLVSLRRLAWAAYEQISGQNKGRLVRWGVANGGRGRCRETGKYTCKTPVGIWQVYEIKKGFARSSLYPTECSDKRKCGHPYYNVIKFGPHFEALHGERDGYVTGMNVSHGCVRMPREDSEFLVKYFVEIGTTILVENY